MEQGFAGALGWWVAAALAAVAAWLWLRRRWRRWRHVRRTRAAFRAERRADRLLVRLGYRIEARQPAIDWAVRVDGEDVPIGLRADLLVSRGGRVYVAEVKAGERAVRVETAATRRQLLEYAVAYGVDGVLLVDMVRREVVEVEFP
ncbi:MAG: hypothetical protein D6689_11640, partial [Deltaproteobacteria bacterium]